MSRQIFRKAALERLQSPEQLDQVIQITTPKGWIALAAVWMLLATAVLWGIYGSVPSKVIGNGMLIKSGGVYKIVSHAAGQITDISVRVGDVVRKGDVVARLAQWDVLDEIRSVKAQLSEVVAKREHIDAFGQRDIEMQKQLMDEQRRLFETSIDSARRNLGVQAELLEQQLAIHQSSITILEDQLKWQKEKITNQQQLFEQGLVVKQALMTSQQRHDTALEEIQRKHSQIERERAVHEQRLLAAKEEIQGAENQIQQLDIKALQLEKQKELELLSLDQQINAFNRQIDALTSRMHNRSRVISPYSGRILEVSLNENDLVGTGTAIMTMELAGREIKDIELVLYVPTADGKKIRPGMSVQVSPSTIKKEEHGALIGTVTSVGLFPASPAGMRRVLGNDSLVHEIMAAGTPIEVYADLTPSSSTYSGYKWTSPLGPDAKIFSGTQCVGEVTVQQQQPITLIIPLLRKTFGIYQ